MTTDNWHFWRSMTRCLVVVVVFTWIMAYLAYTAEAVQRKDGFFHEVRYIYTSDLGVPNPIGVAYLPKIDTFQVMNASPSDQSLSTFTDLVSITMDEKSNRLIRVPVANLDPLNSTFDEHLGGFLILERNCQNLVLVPVGADGNLQPSMLSRHNAKSWGVRKPAGLTVDQDGGQIFILDLSGPRLVKIKPESNKGLDEAFVSEVDLQQLGIVKPQGLAFDPATGHLHLFNQDDQVLYEISQSGQIIATRNLSNLKLKNPQALVFAPSYDQTDDPQQMSLYLTDSGRSNELKTGAVSKSNNSNSGSIIELSLYQPVVIAASSFTSGLNHTIDTSKLTPPSPDPCSVDYIPLSNTLFICDSEVEEMTNLWANANLFETTPGGTLIRTAKTTAFTKEPTGIAYNFANGHIFISDDDGRRIFEVAPGTDKLYGTSDDIRTVFMTSYFGSNDPEGVAFDSTSNTLFIVDGANEEVYLINPGVNSRFDGVPPYGDDQMTSFDTTLLGVHDPEGIAFYPTTGHLYITDTYTRTAVAEVTVDGLLVQIIDVSAAAALKPSGLGFGPCSADPASVAMYMTDRRVDNNADPTENDGRVYELSMSTSNNTPTLAITSPVNETVFTVGDAITFGGSASDVEEGSLSESITWSSSIDGEIGTGSSLTLTNLSIGTHTITAEVTDSKGVTGSASVTITVNPANSVPTVSITDPVNEAVYTAGDSITFSGSASDAEDGDLSASMTWTSSLDGVIGTGSTFTLTNLSVGTHTITVEVTNSKGMSNSDSLNILVNSISQTGKFTPTDDAKVSSINPNKNYGSLNLLESRNSTYTNNSYLKFNVTGLSGTITSAKIRVYSVVNSREGGSIYVVSNNYKETSIPWLESGLTYNNAPSITEEPLSTIKAVTAYSWVDFDVTAAINGDGEYSFALAIANTTSQYIKYNSSEANLNQPELVIETL